MAEVNVKNQNSENEKALEKSSERGFSRRGWDPFSWSLMPSDFFSSDPWTWMRNFHEEMNRTFARFFGRDLDREPRPWSPAIEVAERDGQLHVHAELPGLKPEDVKVEVSNDALVIQGERRYEHEEGQGQSYRSERRYGQFYREIPLPEGANTEQARAQFRDGVLEINIPVSQQANQRRQIPISSEGGASQRAGSQSGAGSSSATAAGAGSSKSGNK